MGLLDQIKPQKQVVRPSELALDDAGALVIRWEDGKDTLYAPRWLRARCPCAGCVDEWSGRRTVGDEQVAADVRASQFHPVGRYAIQIDWSDGHTTGIFSWDYLLQLREQSAAR